MTAEPPSHVPRPAFYALRPGGWRDYVTLLHPPYTAWHLSYAVVGGCLAPSVPWGRLGLTVLAFALAMGVGAHALDELHGRPLATAIPSSVLVALAVFSVAAASAIGIVVAGRTTLWLLAFVAAGAFLVPAYNLELARGLFHSDAWFALAWGAFPALTAYFACAERIRVEAVVAAAWATTLSLAQRRLSTSVRRVRRDVGDVTGEIVLVEGGREPVTPALLTAAPETALRLLAASTVLAAGTLVAFRI
jgi:hypothetical protein